MPDSAPSVHSNKQAGSHPRHVKAEGELARRLLLTQQRLLKGEAPAFDDDFILADVRLRPARRFNNFSGDLSGRWIGAFSVAAVGAPPWERVDRLVRETLACQRADGRFGDERLDFSTSQAIGREHMALLWGNGRLLVGLLEYHSVRPSPPVLAAARRLGDFCLQVRQNCLGSDPGLRDQGAFGHICLTQLSEGWALLARATGEAEYADSAVMMLDALGQRAGVHSHGWLSTLRGVLMAAEDREDRVIIGRVAAEVDDLLNSNECLACGGVAEYIGMDVKRVDIAAHSGGHLRDEGCSEADLARLCLQLWRLTGKDRYLRQCERIFLNHLFASQFPNGDFGSRALSNTGFTLVENIGRAWWCCTPHALRCARDVLDAAVTEEGEGWRIDLAIDCSWSSPNGSGRVQWTATDRMEISSDRDALVRLRQPDWGRFSALGASDAEGFLHVKLKAGTPATISISHRLMLMGRDNHPIETAPVSSVEAAIYLGPWLMTVDDLHDRQFFGEPWPGNLLHWADWRLDRDCTLRLSYEHEGFAGTHALTLRPIGVTGGAGIVSWWLRHADVPKSPSA